MRDVSLFEGDQVGDKETGKSSNSRGGKIKAVVLVDGGMGCVAKNSGYRGTREGSKNVGS